MITLAQAYRQARHSGDMNRRAALEAELVTAALDLCRRGCLTLAQVSTVAGFHRFTLPGMAERVRGVKYLPQCRTTIAA